MFNSGKQFRVEGSHWVSPVNFDEEVTQDFDFPTPLGLVDSTLRKVNYTAGATTTIDGFLRIARALDEIGVRDESLNLDWWGDDEPNARELDLVREVLAGGFGFTSNVYADTLLGAGDGPPRHEPKAVVDLLLELGATVIAPGIVQAASSAAEAEQMRQLETVLGYAHSCGLRSTITLAQAARRDFDSMMRVTNEAVAFGASRIDLMDSTSSLSPQAMRVFIRRFRSALRTSVPITMHVHDDFGLGTAGAIAAAAAGAGPDVSVNGASYRCGFPPLEEVATSLEILYGVDTGIDLTKLHDICELVATETGIPNPQLKPVSGRYAYLKSTPMDVLACLRDGPSSFPPVSGCVHASVVGAEVEWVWDNLSTRGMVRQLAANLGLDVDERQVGVIHDALQSEVAAITTYPRWLEPARAEEICRRVARDTSTDDDTARGLAALNALPPEQAVETLLNCCAWPVWAREVAAARPFASVPDLFAAAVSGAEAIPATALPEVLNTFPQIAVDSGADTTRAAWSRAEEAGVHGSSDRIRAELVEAGSAYRDRFGYTFLISAAGRSGAEVLEVMRRRLDADPGVELDTARRELCTIVGARVQKQLRLLGSRHRPADGALPTP